MILSASRRTDIPNYYSEWFFKRIKEGFLYVRNPRNAHQVSRIELTPERVDCIVFWTKNPAAMIERLDELEQYHYYFQFTLTGYGKDIEPNLPDKRKELIPTFRRLSEKIGKNRIIWRYDPILVNEIYTMEYHIKAFEEIARSLNGYTERVVISFLDLYAKTKKNMAGISIQKLFTDEMMELAGNLAQIAGDNQLTIETCAEQIDLQAVGIRHGSCIDKELTEQITGCRINAGKDKNQRTGCGCLESVEIGTYDTCRNGCRYCYANFSEGHVRDKSRCYDADSPLLCGTIEPGDKITERNIHSLREEQMSLEEIKGVKDEKHGI